MKSQMNTTGNAHQRWGPNFGGIRYFVIGEAHSDGGENGTYLSSGNAGSGSVRCADIFWANCVI